MARNHTGVPGIPKFSKHAAPFHPGPYGSRQAIKFSSFGGNGPNYLKIYPAAQKVPWINDSLRRLVWYEKDIGLAPWPQMNGNRASRGPQGRS